MARHDSKQIKQWEAQGHSPLKTNELHGRVRMAFFQFMASRDSVTATIAQNDDVRLCQIPAGARIIGGEFKHGAFGSSVVLDIGLRALDGSGYLDKLLTVADDPAALATDYDIAAIATATKQLLEDMPYFGYETEKELEVYATFQGANPADDKEIVGFVLYVVD
jgi:hypothetical protein